MVDMTREEALNVFGTINCDVAFKCHNYYEADQTKCEKCRIRQAYKVLEEMHKKLEVYENADLIERDKALDDTYPYFEPQNEEEEH